MSFEIPAGVIVRPATEADVENMHSLLAGAGLSRLAVRECLSAFTVAVAGHDIVGVIGLEMFAGDALLRSMCIAEDWRSRGLGAHLVEHVLTNAAVDAVDDVFLLTMHAQHFFARFGFLAVNRADLPFTVSRAVTRAGECPESATPMRLRIAEH